MKKHFDPIKDKCGDIIEYIMSSPDIPADDGIQFKIRLCTEEVEENILCYSGSTWVEVNVEKTDDNISVGFRDGGVEFDPLAKDDPDITSSLEERQVGGLGIFLCKQMMDYLEYKFEEGCNIFIMRKKLK